MANEMVGKIASGEKNAAAGWNVSPQTERDSEEGCRYEVEEDSLVKSARRNQSVGQ
jgi:hypothetical protein